MAQPRTSFVDQVAANLREAARDYESAFVECFLELGSLHIRWVTNRQNLVANAYLQIARDGFVIHFVTANARTNEPQVLRLPWGETIGAATSGFKIYLKDQSSIEFLPQDQTSYLLLSAFWQVFYDALNGDSGVFHNPVESALGHRLREVANYLIDNRDTIERNPMFLLRDVPARIDVRNRFAHGEPRFPEVRDKINGWRLVEQLGQGGFGQVFKAEHASTGEFAAIKLMSPKRSDETVISPTSAEFRFKRKQFLDEAAMSMKVSSPFAISAVDAGEEPWPWIRYPLVSGKSVQAIVHRSQDPIAEWWNLAHDLISGLSTIHQEGLLHKDVKPDNILHASDRYILADLGIGEIAGYSELVGLGGIGGTLGFMAPELIVLNGSDYKPGPEIDIFSAGMTLLSIFDPQPVIDMRQTQMESLRTNAPVVLREFIKRPISVEGAPAQMRPLLSEMIEIDPKKRPSAKKLLRSVATFVDLAQKLRLIESYRDERIILEDEAQLGGTDNSDVEVIKGPLLSWKRIEEHTYRILEAIRPNYFIIEINPDDEERMVYVQAMSGYGGWHLEAMSEAFAATRQSDEIKRDLMGLNWTPPSSSEPNFTMNLSGPAPHEVVHILMDALEFGYRIAPSQVRVAKLTCQGSGKY